MLVFGTSHILGKVRDVDLMVMSLWVMAFMKGGFSHEHSNENSLL